MTSLISGIFNWFSKYGLIRRQSDELPRGLRLAVDISPATFVMSLLLPLMMFVMLDIADRLDAGPFGPLLKPIFGYFLIGTFALWIVSVFVSIVALLIVAFSGRHGRY